MTLAIVNVASISGKEGNANAGAYSSAKAGVIGLTKSLGKELADKNGCKNYSRVPALGTNVNYIKAMSDLIINKQDYNFNGELFPPKFQCPNQFKKCPCINYE